MEALLIVGGAVRADGASGDGARRLRDCVSRLLQVRELVVLLGSGASFHLGSPSIRNMSASDIEAMVHRHLPEASDLVAPPIRRFVGEGSADLEDLLALLSTALAFASASGMDPLSIRGISISVQDVEELRRALTVALARACELPIDGAGGDDPWSAHREFFRRLLAGRRSDLPPPWVFTTNYDLAIERTLDDSGVTYLDGFTGTVDRAMHLESYRHDLYMPSESTERRLIRVPGMLRFAKIHGSINWRSAISPSGRQTRRVVHVSAARDPGELALIYPTPHKETDVVGHPYADLLRLFAGALAAPETALLSVGYGFADDHINRLIYQALPSNATLQVLVVDPYGVHEEGAFRSGPIAKLAQVPDQRIAALTGEDTRFERFPFTCMPDVDRFDPEGGVEVMAALSDALLGSSPPDLEESPDS